MNPKKTSTRKVKVLFMMPARTARTCVAVVGDAEHGGETVMRLDERNGHWCKAIRLEPEQPVRFRYMSEESARSHASAEAPEAAHAPEPAATVPA